MYMYQTYPIREMGHLGAVKSILRLGVGIEHHKSFFFICIFKMFSLFFLLLLLLDVVKIAFLSLGDLSDPGITLEFPTSQANSLPSETPQKPQNFIPDRNYFVV